MKKFFTFVVAVVASVGASAQEYNLFPSSDGWLMFNSQTTIDQYVGNINETNYKVNTTTGSKMVQTVYADQMPDYPATVADPIIVGAGTDGETGSAGSIKGALVLQPSSANMTPNGGGFIACLPSCTSYTIDYSCNSRVMGRLLATTNPAADMSNASDSYALNDATGWKIISAKYMTVFKRLPAGHNQWTDIATLNNGNDAVTIQSSTPIYVWFQSATKDTVYIHGIKVTTPKQETAGVNQLATNAQTSNKVYTVSGIYMGECDDMKSLHKGFYIIKEGTRTRKIIVE